MENFAFVEAFALKQCFDEGVQCGAVFGQKANRFAVALFHDLHYFFVDGARGFFAEWFGAVRVGRHAAQIRVLARRELHEANPLAHSPARHHLPREICGLFDVAFRAGCLRAVNDLFRGATTKRTNNAAAQILFWIIVPVAFWPLIGDAKRLTAWDNGHSIDRIGAGYNQAENGVTAFVIGNALAF